MQQATIGTDAPLFARVWHDLIMDDDLGDREIGCYAALMKHADFVERNAYPGIDRLALILKCSRTRVIESIKALEANWIDVQRTQGEGNHYHLRSSRRQPVQSVDGGSPVSGRVPVQPVDANENQLTRTNEGERTPPHPRAAFASEIADAFNAITGRNEILWPDTYRNIDAILVLMPEWGLRDESAQMAAFRAVITLKHGEWGDDPKMASALTMAVLFKDPRRFNGYLNATPAYQQMVAGKRDTMDKKTCPHCKISGGRHAVSCPTLTKQEAS